MSSYYREHVSYPNVTAGPYPPQLAATLDNVANIQDDSNPRHCSVKGCSALLAPDYPHKMCEECRGRHRVYAMTKRAKRKMEKALLNGSAQNGQPVAWMPPDDAAQAEEEHPGQPPEPVAGPSRQFEVNLLPISQIPCQRVGILAMARIFPLNRHDTVSVLSRRRFIPEDPIAVEYGWNSQFSIPPALSRSVRLS